VFLTVSFGTTVSQTDDPSYMTGEMYTIYLILVFSLVFIYFS
jgi:hypothetical protein